MSTWSIVLVVGIVVGIGWPCYLAWEVWRTEDPKPLTDEELFREVQMVDQQTAVRRQILRDINRPATKGRVSRFPEVASLKSRER